MSGVLRASIYYHNSGTGRCCELYNRTDKSAFIHIHIYKHIQLQYTDYSVGTDAAMVTMTSTNDGADLMN